MNATGPAEARRTYDAFAAGYDDFNHRYMYERWTARLLERARAAGLVGDRLLDLGCGTGLSFIPMIPRGFRVVGSDISPAMLGRARAKVGGEVRLELADMRTLPRLGEFDLVWAVNDAVNYLLGRGELQAALTGMRRNLAPGGVVLFDVNTLAGYREFFAAEHRVEHNGRSFHWWGQGAAADLRPGGVFEAVLDGEAEGFEVHRHRQRHFDQAEVLAALIGAGLRCVEIAGERDGALSPGVEELEDTKAVYVCRRNEGLGEGASDVIDDATASR